MANIKDRIIELREKAGLTQEQFAQEFKVAKSTVSMWEQGNRIPRPNTMAEICDYFNIDMNYLTGMDDIPNRYKAGIPYDWEQSDSEISKIDKLNFITELKRVLKSKNEPVITLMNKYDFKNLDITVSDDILFKISDEYNIPIKQNRYLNKTFNHTSKIKNWFITTINSLSDNELDRLKPILEQTIKIIKNNKGEFNE